VSEIQLADGDGDPEMLAAGIVEVPQDRVIAESRCRRNRTEKCADRSHRAVLVQPELASRPQMMDRV
jgi:hypothetical protein